MKVYRVENEAEQKGLWRKFDGTWQPLFDMLTDGKCKDMPMEDSPIYRDGGKRWFASAPSKEALQKWFSKIDLEELVSKGFTISEFEVVGYKKVSEFEYIFTRDNIINRNYLEVSDIYSEQKDFEQKIEPKFHEGEWVVWDNKIPCHIDNIYRHIDNIYQGKETLMYTITDTNNMTRSYSVKGFDNNAHLWTIQDAKDGDVLTCYSDIKGQPIEQTGIIKQYVGRHGGCSNSFKAHFGVDWDNNVVIEGYMGSSNIYPSTKEQRNLLFQKMKEAGYEWDADTKELKEIKQKPAWSEEDEMMLCDAIGAVGAADYYTYDDKQEIEQWLKSLKDRIK